jgi:hypothetical protein
MEYAFWKRQIRTVHWMSGAICLIGMLLFAATGITLNHAADIPSRPRVSEVEATLAPPLLALLETGPDKGTTPALPVAIARQLKTELAAVQGAGDPASVTLATAIRGSLRTDVSEASVREEVERVAASGINALKSHLGLFDTIGSLAPLLGLLGTVLGMIQAFRAMEAAGRNVDPAILSGGIWAALLTTAAGLIVAIPVVAIASWFDRSILQVARKTEDAVTRIFTPDLTRRTESPVDEGRAAHI